MTAIETTAAELTPELLDLFEHEKVIEQGLAGFIDVGNSLLAIKADRKYRHVGYATFEDYCQDRWNISRAYGYRLINAASVAESLAKELPGMSPIGDIPLPVVESQVRPLAGVPEAERAEVWAEAVEGAGGEQPTAAAVAAVVERRKPMPVPKPTSKPAAPISLTGDMPADDTLEAPPHPATYPAAVMAIFRELIPAGSRVLDPFAGIGTIHELRPDCLTWGIEIEPEWGLVSDFTIIGDARQACDLFEDDEFDVIATSPAYGNRLADAHYNASDPESRRTYALDLGRPLSDGSGAGLHFATDGRYETLHRSVWAEVVAMLKPGGLFLLNCKDFQRDGKIMPVTGWHVGALHALGLEVVDLRVLPAAGLPFTTAKPISELVVVLRSPS